MTSPSLGPGNVPANVMQASQLGAMLQHLNPAKVNDHSTGQYPGVMSGTNAGLAGGVMDVITGVFSQFIGQIAEDGGTLPTDPSELDDLVVDFFANLPVDQVMLSALAVLLGWLTDTDPADYDTVEEIRDNLIPALIRLPVKVIVDLISSIFGSIPVVGDDIETALAQWMADQASNGVAANATANKALAIAQGILAGGGSHSETFEGSGALDTGLWTVAASRVQRVDGNLGITTQTGDGTYQDWFVYKNQFTGDDQSVAVVFGKYGTTSLDTGIFLRCNADATRFVYLNCFSNKVYLGQGTRSGGSWTFNDWTSQNVDLAVGNSVQLTAVGDLFTVIINGQQILTYPDTAQTGPKGASYRSAGGKIEQTRIFFTSTRSFHLRALAISDM